MGATSRVQNRGLARPRNNLLATNCSDKPGKGIIVPSEGQQSKRNFCACGIWGVRRVAQPADGKRHGKSRVPSRPVAKDWPRIAQWDLPFMPPYNIWFLIAAGVVTHLRKKAKAGAFRVGGLTRTGDRHVRSY